MDGRAVGYIAVGDAVAVIHGAYKLARAFLLLALLAAALPPLPLEPLMLLPGEAWKLGCLSRSRDFFFLRP